MPTLLPRRSSRDSIESLFAECYHEWGCIPDLLRRSVRQAVTDNVDEITDITKASVEAYLRQFYDPPRLIRFKKERRV